MTYRITAWCANGDVRPLVEEIEDLTRARQTADWMHNNPAMKSVELEEPFGVRLTKANGESVYEFCETLEAANDAAASWSEVVANKKTNRTRIRQVAVMGVVPKTATATPEDHLLGEFLADALEDHKVLPSVKFNINRWMDSKVWT